MYEAWYHVPRVEQVAAEEVERSIVAREHPRQHALDARDQEQSEHEVVVGEEHHPVDAPQCVQPVVAEEARLIAVAVEVRRAAGACTSMAVVGLGRHPCRAAARCRGSRGCTR